MQGIADGSGVLLAVSQNFSDLLPYIGLVGAGFLIGAWGQEARVPIATALGLLLIVIGVFAFIVDNMSGPGGSSFPKP